MARIAGGGAAGILTAVMGSLVAAGGASAAPYKVTEYLGDHRYFGLNDRGQVFGTAGEGPSSRAFVFDSLGPGRYRIMDEPTAPGGVTGGRGDVFVTPPGPGPHAVYDVETGRAALLDLPEPYRIGVKTVDGAGRMYGETRHGEPVIPIPGSPTEPSPYYSRPFVAEDGKVRELDLPAGMGHATLAGVNAAGDVLIQAGVDANDAPEAYLLRDGAWTHLGAFQGRGLNDRGDVLGFVRLEGPAGGIISTLIPADGSEPIALGDLAGAHTTFPFAINNRGEVMGYGFFTGGVSTPFIYRDGVATDLNALIERAGVFGELQVRFIHSINSLGQILASGTDGDRQVNFLLSPGDLDVAEGVFDTPNVPEPSALLVFAGLALGAGLVRRGRRG
ncbi:hypothetical protein [Paludisphaera sp.]|uniref:hypothetical protein n=1 Tax=Paludisphaera sp. TaxID=2017432 RepID=UPI00301BBEE3